MGNYTTISFNGVALQVLSCSANKIPRTRKYALGKQLVEVPILGINAQQWELSLTCVITASTHEQLGIKRAEIEELDDVEAYDLVDGIHDGSYYIVPGSLIFSDSGEGAGMIYRYTVRLIEA